MKITDLLSIDFVVEKLNMLSSHVHFSSFSYLLSKRTYIFDLVWLFQFHKCRFSNSFKISFRLPPQVHSKRIHKPDLEPLWNQNLIHYLISLFFIYWCIRLFSLNSLWICSSIDWCDSACKTSWKCCIRWWNKGGSLTAKS